MGKKILLADDSITIQKVIELTFSDEDFEVVTVGNGRLAIERIQESHPDVVLCDIIMPEKDGYDVCDFVKKNPALSHIPVLLLAGAFEPFDQERANRVKSDGFLAKPFEPQTLIARVKELINRAPASAPAPAPPPPAAVAAPQPELVTEPVAMPESEEINFIPEEPYAPAAAPQEEIPLESSALEEEFYPIVEPSEEPTPAGMPDLEMVPEYEEAPTPFLVEAPSDFEEPQAAEQRESSHPGGAEMTPETPTWSEPTEEMSWEDRAKASRENAPGMESPAAMFDEVFEEELTPEPAAAPDFMSISPSEMVYDEARFEAAPAAPTEVARRSRPEVPVEVPPSESFSDVAPPPEAKPAERIEKSVTAELAVPKDMVAQIAQRVIGQMSENIVREIVWEVVPELAEVLIKKEIERLRAELKETT